MHFDVVSTFSALLKLSFVFFLINTFNHPALDVFHILWEIFIGTPNKARFSILFAAFINFEAFHSGSFL
jgi:hypothetical protein